MSVTLAATNTISGVAGTATAVTYTLNGDEISGTPATDAFKPLAQGQLPTSVGTLYTVPGSTQALLSSIVLVNTSGVPVTGIKLFQNGTAATNQILQSLSIPANGRAVIDVDGDLQVTDVNGAIVTASSAVSAKNYAARVFARQTWR